MPDPSSVVDFSDCAVRFIDEETNGPAFRQIEKSPANNCYITIPVAFAIKPPDHAVKRYKQFMNTAFAGNLEIRKALLCTEALVFFGVWRSMRSLWTVPEMAFRSL